MIFSNYCISLFLIFSNYFFCVFFDFVIKERSNFLERFSNLIRIEEVEFNLRYIIFFFYVMVDIVYRMIVVDEV